MQKRYISTSDKVFIFVFNIIIWAGLIFICVAVFGIITVGADNIIPDIEASKNFVEGTIVAVEEESRGASKNPLNTYTVSYQVDNKTYTLVCSSTKPTNKSTATIQYLPDAPEQAIMVGFGGGTHNQQNAPFVLNIFYFLVLPLGFLVLIIGIKKSFNTIRIVEDGELAWAKFSHTKTEVTKDPDGDTTLHTAYFIFIDNKGKKQQAPMNVHNLEKFKESDRLVNVSCVVLVL